MKREDVLKLFPDATDEQITQVLNAHHADLDKEKKKFESYKEAQKQSGDKSKELEEQNAELQKKLDEIEEGKLSEIEKANKALDAANQRIAELEKNQRIADQRNEAVSKFKISAEQAKEVIKDDGAFDYDKLGEIIAEKESAAALAKEQEIAAASTNPGGGSGKQGENESPAMQMAKKLTPKATGVNQDILANLRR